jgi:hypothetical protein
MRAQISAVFCTYFVGKSIVGIWFNVSIGT